MVQNGSGGKKQSLNGISRQNLTLEELQIWKNEISNGTDQACVLIGTAYLDQILTTAIAQSYFRYNLTEKESAQIFADAQAPLGSFSAKINVAFALMHFGPVERDDLHSIRRIRNAFAHAPRPLQFEDKLIANECRKFTIDPLSKIASASPHRSMFTSRCLDLVLTIHKKTLKVAEDRVAKLKAATEGLSKFRSNLRDPNNPLNPHYKSPSDTD